MENNFKEIKKKYEQLHLSTKEKNALGEHLVRFMKEHPIEHTFSPLKKSPLSGISFTFILHRFGTLAVMLFLVFGTTTVLASEKAIPGDTLYPVKLSIETFQEKLLSDETRKRAFSIERAERRLAEAEQLASEGKIDTKTHGEIAALFEHHIETFEQNETTSEDDELTDDFEATLAIHESVLTALKETNNAPLGSLIAQVQKKRSALKARNHIQIIALNSRRDALLTEDTGVPQAMFAEDTPIRKEISTPIHTNPAQETSTNDEPARTLILDEKSSDARRTALKAQEEATRLLERAENSIKEINSVAGQMLKKAEGLYDAGEKDFTKDLFERAEKLFKESTVHARKSIAVLNIQKRVQFNISSDILLLNKDLAIEEEEEEKNLTSSEEERDVLQVPE
jgi:hypothetical protein